MFKSSELSLAGIAPLACSDLAVAVPASVI